MAIARHGLGWIAGLLTGFFFTSAHADLKLCNRMSYVIDAAIAIDDSGNANSRGWYRLDPGQCRATLQGPLPSGDF